jgi:hypothetical protein
MDVTYLQPGNQSVGMIGALGTVSHAGGVSFGDASASSLGFGSFDKFWRLGFVGAESSLC